MLLGERLNFREGREREQGGVESLFSFPLALDRAIRKTEIVEEGVLGGLACKRSEHW